MKYNVQNFKKHPLLVNNIELQNQVSDIVATNPDFLLNLDKLDYQDLIIQPNIFEIPFTKSLNLINKVKYWESDVDKIDLKYPINQSEDIYNFFKEHNVDYQQPSNAQDIYNTLETVIYNVNYIKLDKEKDE